MKRLVICTLVLAGLAVPASAGTARVSVRDDRFAPALVTVGKGTKVKWIWKGESVHDVVVKSGPQKFRSDLQKTGTFVHKMTKRGTYQLLCSTHAPDMKMTLVVK